MLHVTLTFMVTRCPCTHFVLTKFGAQALPSRMSTKDTASTSANGETSVLLSKHEDRTYITTGMLNRNAPAHNPDNRNMMSLASPYCGYDARAHSCSHPAVSSSKRR